MNLKKIFKKWKWIILSLIFLIIALSDISAEFQELGGDSAQYIILAESLAQKKGLRLTNFPGEPYSTFPPLFSLILAPIIYFLGRNYWTMHFLIICLAYLTLIIFYKLFERESTKEIAFPVIIFLAVSRLFWSYSQKILTEIPFLFLSGFCFFILAKYKNRQSYLNKEAFLTTIALLLTYFCRYIGALVFCVSLCYIFLEKPHNAEKNIRRKKLWWLSITFLPLFLYWNSRNAAIHNPYVPSAGQFFLWIDGYRRNLGQINQNPILLIFRFVKGINFYLYSIGEAIFPYFMHKFQAPVFRDLFSLIAISLTLLGLQGKIREGRYAFGLYFLSYIIIISLWPYYEDGRYILPILPFVFFYFFLGVDKIAGFLTKKAFSQYTSFFIIILFAFNLSAFAQNIRSAHNVIPEVYNNFIALHSWMKKNLPEDEAISEEIAFSRKPTFTYFFTGKKSIVYPFDPNPDTIWQMALKEKVKYILVDEFSRETLLYMWPFLNKYRDKLKLVYRQGNSAIFEVRL